MTLTAGQVFGETKTFQDPDPATIEQQVRALNWENPQQRPLIHLARIANSGDSSVTIKVQGTLGKPNDDGAMRAVVIISQPESSIAAESAPLESVDKAIELLLVARNEPDKLRGIAQQWAQQPGSGPSQ